MRWLVDPIDGTKSFIRGSRYYSTQIALEVDNELRLGVSNAPAYGECLVAEAGKGAWLDGRQVHCNEVTSIDDAFFSAGNLTTLARDAEADHVDAVAAEGRAMVARAEFDLGDLVESHEVAAFAATDHESAELRCGLEATLDADGELPAG